MYSEQFRLNGRLELAKDGGMNDIYINLNIAESKGALDGKLDCYFKSKKIYQR